MQDEKLERMSENIENPHDPTSDLHWSGWISRVRWLAAEIVVIVAGVLIAMALNAWWQNRQSRAQEQVYLHQLDGDLAASERLIESADSMYREVDRRGNLLVRAFRMSVRPPRDSVESWFAHGFWQEPLEPVTATAEALVFSGNITLIRDDSLRAAVTRYVGSMNKAAERQQIWAGEYYRAVERLTDYVDVIDAGLQSTPIDRINQLARTNLYAPYPENPVAPAFSYPVDNLFQNKDVYRALWTANNWKRNLAVTRAEMLTETHALRAAVQKEIH